MTISSRAQAHTILQSILYEKKSWDRSLLPKDSSSHAFIQALCLGVLRHYLPLQAFLSQFLEKPLRQKDQDIQVLLLMGTFELLCLSTPEYAVVNELQRAVPAKKSWAKGLINAVLRKVIQEKNHSPAALLEQYPTFPAWIQDLWKTHYPEFLSHLRTANALPPMHLRINTRQISRADYVQQFPSLAIQIPPFFADALTLETPCPVESLPGFLEGLVSVQDLAPQKTPELLDLAPQLSVLDACAAPGGKSAHLLEKYPDIRLTCLDISADRTEKIRATFSRLRLQDLHPEIFTQDALDTASLNKTFDRILLDAPCSGLGVIRRHPEIALHRSPENLASLAQTQLALLTTLWRQLNPEGILLYATCSLAPIENDGVIGEFLSQHPDATLIPLDLSHPGHLGKAMKYGYQFLPTQNGPDGFYYAKLMKRNP
jgi:16S rRNA (cytosine967-C5)-methyltransferase